MLIRFVILFENRYEKALYSVGLGQCSSKLDPIFANRFEFDFFARGVLACRDPSDKN